MSKLESSAQDGYSIVHLTAACDQLDWLAFRGRVNREFIDRGVNRVIVDCRENADLPSIAYGSLTSLSRDLRRINGLLLLVHVSSKDRMVMSRTGIDQFIPIYATMGELLRTPPPAAAMAPQPMTQG